MTKADELVERVADKLGHVQGYMNEQYPKEFHTKMARQILSDPDLYLQITGEPSPTMDLGDGDESYCVVSYIPLAELMI